MQLFVIALWLLSGSAISRAQDSEYLISPNPVGLVVGGRQRLQVLDRQGRDVTSALWSIESGDGVIAVGVEYGDALVDPTEVAGASGPSYVAALAPGKGMVRATVDGREFTANVTVYPGPELPPGTVARSMPPLLEGARVRNQLQSRKVSEETPDLYVQEGTDKGSYIRAFYESGIQKWVWPSPREPLDLRLICGDNFGGAVVAIAVSGAFQTAALRHDGTERWRVSTAPWWAYTYTDGNLLYIVEDHPDVPVLTALDGETGERKVQIPLPTNLTQHVGYVPPPGMGAKCVPGSSVSRSGPSSHGSLFTDENDTVYLPINTLNATFDATGCAPELLISSLTAKLTVDSHLQLLSVNDNGETTWRTIRRQVQTVTWERPTEWLYPWGSPIPDGHGGALIPARGQLGSILDGKALLERGSVFRVNGDAVHEYHMPVLPPKDRKAWNMLLGEDDRGFFAGDRAIVAFNVLDGKILWVWRSQEPILMIGALVDGSVLVEIGDQPSRRVERVDAAGKSAGVVLKARTD
ncbi:MAG: hypothetical protein HYX28_07810 [Candidatus Koribacter versatilis]|uniref:Pyrrolo-quinoline quinone n=1 Tax=Candidatus Korobacter versatilis TaxID=658062 RepID=A0A932EPZ7_9BACT|nr:hypothetical protein [Candidatus Koribacter versatilis]